MQGQRFRICEGEIVRRRETLQGSQALAIWFNLDVQGAQLTVMMEQISNALFVDGNAAPETQPSDAVELDEP